MKGHGYHIGQGLAWLGFWIGLGLYNFGGCSKYYSQKQEEIPKLKAEASK